jgi:hypothetical protein
MKKYVCQVCGYVHEGDSAPDQCPICKAAADRFTEQSGERFWADEHIVGVAKGASEDILEFPYFYPQSHFLQDLL